MLLGFVLAWNSCGEAPSQSDNKNAQNHSQLSKYRIYVGYEGNVNHGVLIIDPVEFKVIDTVLLENVPLQIILSSDSSHLHVSQMESTSVGRIILLDMRDKNVTGEWIVDGLLGAISNDEEFFFTVSFDGFSVYEKNTVDIVFSLKDSLIIRRPIADPLHPGFYAGFRYVDSGEGIDGILHYDVELNSVDQKYDLLNAPNPLGGSLADLAVSHDGQLLFLSVYVGGGIGPESYLHVIDIRLKEQIAKELISGEAQLAVTTDNESVYITDPGVPPLNETVPPSGILRRYDVHSHNVEDFVDLKLLDITPTFANWPAVDQIELFEENQFSVLSGLDTGADIVVFDMKRKEVVGKIGLGRGHLTQLVRSVTVGRALDN